MLLIILFKIFDFFILLNIDYLRLNLVFILKLKLI